MIKIHGSSGIEFPNNYSIKSDSGDLEFNHDIKTIARASSEHFEEFNRPLCDLGHEPTHKSYNGDRLKLQQVLIDTHNAYDVSSGDYTVPLAGKYLCLCRIMGKTDGSTNMHFYFKPYRNGNWYPGSNWCHSQYGVTRNYETITGNWIIEGEYGDTFSLGIYTKNSSAVYGGYYHSVQYIYLSS